MREMSEGVREQRERGRPALRWPACDMPLGFRVGRKPFPKSKLTRALVKHCRKCSGCETFHARRFTQARWRAAWVGNTAYMGTRPCEKCGDFLKRVHDGGCYPCFDKARGSHAGIRDRVKPSGPLVDAKGGFCISRDTYLQRKHDAPALKREAEERAAVDGVIDRTAQARNAWGSVWGDATRFKSGRVHLRLWRNQLHGCFGQYVALDDRDYMRPGRRDPLAADLVPMEQELISLLLDNC